MNVDTNTLALIISVVLPLAWQLGGVLAAALLNALPAAKRDRVEALVAQVVAAVEQANKDVPGPQKKALALTLIGRALSAAHLKADQETVDRLLEASVLALSRRPSAA